MAFVEIDGRFFHDNQEFILSDNNIIAFDAFNPDKLYAAELAVFAGQLFKAILGVQQPDYFFGQATSGEDVTYYRICNKLDNYKNWLDIASIKNNNLIIQWDDERYTNPVVNHLTSILVAGHFLGELDWNDTNFGLVKKDAQFYAVRLDPGCSFGTMLNNRYEDLEGILRHLLVKYVSLEINNFDKENMNDTYLEELINHEKGLVRNSKAKELFGSWDEVIKTTEKITDLSKRDFSAIADDSFTEKNRVKAQPLIDKLIARQAQYSHFLHEHQLRGKNLPKADLKRQLQDLKNEDELGRATNEPRFK